MRKTVCEWKSSDGKHALKIGTNVDCGAVWVWVKIDGLIERECAGPGRQEHIVNGVGYPASIGRVALTAERLAALDAAVATENATLKNTREGLRRERESLVDRCRSDHSDTERAWERGEEDECFRLRAVEDARVAKAMEVLRQFDLQHPEVLEAIRREQTERVNRHMWD